MTDIVVLDRSWDIKEVKNMINKTEFVLPDTIPEETEYDRWNKLLNYSWQTFDSDRFIKAYESYMIQNKVNQIKRLGEWNNKEQWKKIVNTKTGNK